MWLMVSKTIRKDGDWDFGKTKLVNENSIRSIEVEEILDEIIKKGGFVNPERESYNIEYIDGKKDEGVLIDFDTDGLYPSRHFGTVHKELNKVRHLK